jgi:AGZA family xanthine/uracil permease-like MFS transporter
MNIINQLDNFFGVSQLGSNFRTEIFAGVSTFLALSYIFVVNPAILSAAGMDKSAVFFATIVGSVIATLAMGLWANKPFAVAPGLEMNAYVAYVVVGSLGFSWQGAMGAVFWSGVLTVLLSLTPLRVNIVNAIPSKLKSGLAAAVGVFLMLIALKVSGILIYQGVQVKGFGLLTSHEAVVFWLGLILALGLKTLKIKGSVLFSIIGASAVFHYLGTSQIIEPINFGKEMFSGLGALDLGVIFNPKIFSVILVLFILDFYGSIAKFIGLTQNTSILDAQGNMPKLKEALVVDGGGTVLGAALGTSNLITYVESAVGIGEGGRTGLVSVVCGLLMALFLLLTPLINLVPVVATTGALFFVGLSLLPWQDFKQSNDREMMLSLLVIVMVIVWTFDLTKAMFAGFVSFVILKLVLKKFNEANLYLIVSTLLLGLSIWLS